MADQNPSIIILKSADFVGSKPEEVVCWGIEEEGIPFQVQSDPESLAARLAYKAALISRLNVGIGIGVDGTIAVHYSQMDEKAPLFICRSDSENNDRVTLGINAARLVKGLPFKEL